MRRPLFWKILLGFWLTVICISQGVWLLLSVPMPILDIKNSAYDVEIFAISIGKAAVEKGGLPQLEAQTKDWPKELRQGLQINKPVRTASNPGGTAVLVTDPQGRQHSIGYRFPTRRYIERPKFVVLSILGGLLFSSLLAWYLIRPIWRIRAAFGKLSTGDFSVRLTPLLRRRRDEISDLAMDFDQMAQRLQTLVASRDQMLATISHELRCPLARLQLAIGLIRQNPDTLAPALQRIEEEARQLDHLLGDVLTLCRIESSGNKGDEYFDVAKLLETVVSDNSFEASAKGVAINFKDSTKGANICRGSAKLIRSAFENLIRNSIRHSQSGQHIAVTLENQAKDFARTTIRDEGPGLPQEVLETLFQPFSKGAKNAVGFGLGLAIAHRAVIAHGGTLILRNEAAGGLSAVLLLPIQTGLEVSALPDP